MRKLCAAPALSSLTTAERAGGRAQEGLHGKCEACGKQSATHGLPSEGVVRWCARCKSDPAALLPIGARPSATRLPGAPV